MNPLDFNLRLKAARDLMEAGNHVEALRVYGELAQKYPKGGLYGEYARAATIYGDFDLAEQQWARIRAIRPKTVDLLLRFAWEYQNIRFHTRALELYREAVQFEPKSLEAQLGLAWVLVRTGEVKDARAVVDKCLFLDSRGEKARYMVACLDRRENKLEEAEREFRELLASNLQDGYIRYSCHAELAAILDRTERFDEAMQFLIDGKKLPRTMGEEEGERRQVDAWQADVLQKTKSLPKNILASWNKAFPVRERRPEISPVFLTGSARSGTTLLERILDAHPSVNAADESLAFSKVMPTIDLMAPSIPVQKLNVQRRRYLNIFTKTAGLLAPGKIMLDKNPSRTVWLPAFLRVFPELKVLIGLRDPRDVVVSLYFQNQSLTNFLTLEQLAQYYTSIMEIWLTVREWEGLNWLETRYEDVVGDVEKEGARVNKFLGLEWHQDQARFYESNREKPVMSTNYQDVSRPIYTKSVARWRVYEKYLAPMLPTLEPYCKKFGYS